jgi:hypothetical protein
MSELQSKLEQSLLEVRAIQPQNREKRRIKLLSKLVFGMMTTKSSHLSQISSELSDDIDAKSKETAAKRFLSNKWIKAEEHYLPLLKAFLSVAYFLNRNKEIYFVIDGTQIGKNHTCLMISMVWQKHAIPICWHVKLGGKGNFTEQNHLDLMVKLKEIVKNNLAKDSIITFLGDGEFDGISLQEFCLKQGWNYVFRTRKDSILYEDEDKFLPHHVTPASNQASFFISHVGFTEKRFPTNFLCWHDKKLYKEPIYLLTNMTNHFEIVSSYDKRFSTECLFKDFKSNGFYLHKTRLKDDFALSNLIMIAAIAVIFLALLAIQFQKPENQQLIKKIMVVRKNKKTLSFFTFALRLFNSLRIVSINFMFIPKISNKKMHFIQNST